ncbi:hypothetical protein GZH49_01045 [Nocardia terpenica]|uniref:hypothetical protein n=1 Tax=Nocardia terpenica TaxID=455432 RepID=UPI002FE2F933
MNTVADNTTRFPDTLDAVQYQGIVESMPPPWHVFTDFLVISGARLGEAAALTDTDLDPDVARAESTGSGDPVQAAGCWLTRSARARSRYRRTCSAA